METDITEEELSVWFDPVTPCSTCEKIAKDYIHKNRSNKNKEDIIEFDHNESCIWYNKCIEKIKNVNPDIRIFCKQNRARRQP